MRTRTRMGTWAGLALLAFLTALAVAPVARAEDAEAEAMFRAGLEHMRAGRAEIALEEFQRAVKRDAKNCYFHKGVGVANLYLNRLPEAIASFRCALEVNPFYVDARNDLGTALVLAGQRDEGKKELLRAFNDPMNPTPQVTARNLGRAFYDEQQYEQAESWFRSSATRSPRYVDAHTSLAETLIRLNRIDEAISHLERAVQTTADDPAVVFALGEAYYRAGRFKDARPRLELVVKKGANPALTAKAEELLKHIGK